MGADVRTLSKRVWAIVRAGAVALVASASGAEAQPVADDADANVLLTIMPIAALEIVGGNLLYLEVPPADSTVPSSGVSFKVIGNASAILTAEPDSFVEVPANGYMGAAYLNGNAVGYKLELRFPSSGVVGSPIQIAPLPGFEAGPTTPPLGVNLTLTGGERQGVLHMESSADWTEDGGIPLPGTYVGSVTLTVTATN
jgi:hypothetical protein